MWADEATAQRARPAGTPAAAGPTTDDGDGEMVER